jgi:hypothetical protein
MTASTNRAKRIAFWFVFALLSLSVAFLARLHYLREHCEETYGTNPWTGGGHANIPWWCLTPTENRRVRAAEEQAKRNGAEAYQ